MHAGGVNIELEASAVQSTTLLCSTHLPPLEAALHIPALLIIFYHCCLTQRRADWLPVL